MGGRSLDERCAFHDGSDDFERDERLTYNPHELHGIPPEQVAEVWSLVEPWLIDSAERTRGKYSAADIRDGFLSGHAQLWLWHSPTAIGVLVTEISAYPQNRCCVISTGCGTSPDEWWEASLKRIEEFARYAGCSDMLIICRPGWEKRIRTCGYDKTHVYLEKRL